MTPKEQQEAEARRAARGVTPPLDEFSWQPCPRNDGRMEWLCPHGVGHGNHTHGCDGCCERLDYPGRTYVDKSLDRPTVYVVTHFEDGPYGVFSRRSDAKDAISKTGNPSEWKIENFQVDELIGDLDD